MSLVVALQLANNDVVLAADRRATQGDPRGLVAIDENVRKLFHFGSGAALGIVGFPSAILDPMAGEKRCPMLRIVQTMSGQSSRSVAPPIWQT